MISISIELYTHTYLCLVVAVIVMPFVVEERQSNLMIVLVVAAVDNVEDVIARMREEGKNVYYCNKRNKSVVRQVEKKIGKRVVVKGNMVHKIVGCRRGDCACAVADGVDEVTGDGTVRTEDVVVEEDVCTYQ